MLRAILIFLFFVCSDVNASTCYLGDELLEKYNEKYSHLFEVSTDFQDGAYNVVVSIPKTIEGAEFKDATILKGTMEKIGFFSVLKTMEVDGVTKVYFVAKPSPNEGYSLSFSYGTCDFYITIPVALE